MGRLLSGVSLSEKEEKKIRKKVEKMNDPIEEYAELIAPNLVGITEKKKAILLGLTSLFDDRERRWRINSIMYGPPGTGKSRILTWLRDELSVGFAGKKSTEAGLVGSMSHSRPTKGKLPKNNMGILAVDELDKMSKTDRDGLLEAMSDGTVTLTGGDVDKEYKANTIIISAVNNLSELGEKLTSRFDFQIYFSKYDRDTGEKILRSWNDNSSDEEKLEELKKYLKAVRGFTPKKDVSPGFELIEKLWDQHNVTEIAPREHIERFNRVALAHARLNFRNPTKVDFWKSIEMLMQDSYPELERLL